MDRIQNIPGLNSSKLLLQMSMLMCQCNDLNLKGSRKNKKSGRQCMYDVTLLQWKRNKYYKGWNFNSGNYLFTTDTK